MAARRYLGSHAAQVVKALCSPTCCSASSRMVLHLHRSPRTVTQIAIINNVDPGDAKAKMRAEKVELELRARQSSPIRFDSAHEAYEA